MVSLCEHYPVPRHAKLVETLLELVSKEAASDDLKHGILLFFLGIVKMKRSFLDSTDSMRKVSLKMLQFCLDNIGSANHTIVSSSVDIINQLLTDYANNDILWTSSHYELWGISYLISVKHPIKTSLFILFFYRLNHTKINQYCVRRHGRKAQHEVLCLGDAWVPL